MEPFNDYMTQMAGQTISAMGNITKIWTDMMTNMAMSGCSFVPGSTPPEAARQVRGSVLRTMAEAIEDSMRTPQFMEMLRQSMDTMLGFRKQVDGMMSQMRQSTQGTTREDIDTLMVTIRHMERRILDRMEDLTDRLDDFEERLDQAAGNGQARESSRRRRRPSGRQESSARME